MQIKQASQRNLLIYMEKNKVALDNGNFNVWNAMVFNVHVVSLERFGKSS